MFWQQKTKTNQAIQALEQSIIAVVSIDEKNRVTFLIMRPNKYGAIAKMKSLATMWLCCCRRHCARIMIITLTIIARPVRIKLSASDGKCLNGS